MNYEEMLSDVLEKVDTTIVCERFEIKKVEGHHEGLKTIITNFVTVSNCLRRDPSHISRYLSKELAAQVEVKGDRLIINRKVSSKQVNEKIEKYTSYYVICGTCKKPDTEIIKDGGKIYLRCLACGAKKEIHNI